MVIFEIFQRQNLRGACPRTPLQKRHANFKKYFLTHPLPNPGDAPVYTCSEYENTGAKAPVN